MTPDVRFKDSGGFCKLCHKICYDSEKDALRVIANTGIGLKNTYPCPLYPSGYWHTTRRDKLRKIYYWKAEVRSLGPKRSKRIFTRIAKILAS